ncbi:hypothetical protein ACTFIY_011717 [Dictyostelium cf. discoideum]
MTDFDISDSEEKDIRKNDVKVRKKIEKKIKTNGASRYGYDRKNKSFQENVIVDDWFASNLKFDLTMQVLGKRRSGKSYASRWILHKIAKNYCAVYVMTKTKMNKWWQQCVPEKYIFEEWSPHIIQKIFDRNKAIIDAGLQKFIDTRILFILDDIIGEDSFKNDEVLKNVFILGRHYHVGFMILTQYAYALHPLVRGNTDYVLTTLQSQNRQREAIAKDYADIVDKNAFYELLDNNTTDNHLLVIDLSKPTINVDDVFSRFKADNPGPFRVGSEKCWDKHEKQIQMIYNNKVRLEMGWDTEEDQEIRKKKFKKKLEKYEKKEKEVEVNIEKLPKSIEKKNESNDENNEKNIIIFKDNEVYTQK